MANVPHSGLTGADLHESKGTAAAAANTVFVADGAGSGSYQKVPGAALSSLSNPFGAQLLHVREEQTSGVGPSTASTGGGVWITRAINTVKTNEISSSSLASNQITLPAGTYFIEALAQALVAGNAGTPRVQMRLYNVTAAAVLLTGLNIGGVSNTTGTPSADVTPIVRGRFTLSGSSVVRLECVANNLSTAMLGGEATSQSTECYLDALIWKIA